MSIPESFDIKEVLSVAAPLIKGVVDKFVIPKIETLKARFSLEISKNYLPTADHFQEYFYRTYKKLSVINTLVFNNSQKLLKDIYIPLTIKSLGKKEIRNKIESYPKSLVAKHKKILLTDTAGMGKSTLMKRIFLDIIDSQSGIPILIELRRLSKEKKIIDEIHEQLSAINNSFKKELLLELLIEGEFILILDGYDEIAISDREDVTKDIQNFISKISLNYFFLTSRPEGALKSFGDFQEFAIEPLKQKEAFELLRKYDNQGGTSALLIKKLQEPSMANIGDFLTNPLLVSLLFTAFEYKQVIPFKKHIFYRQVYDANFESHDLTKGDSYMHNKYCNLDIDDFHRVLRAIGFKCLKLQKIEFTKDELLQIIGEAQSFCTGIEFKESDFLRDLLTTVPLFSQDGIYYKWSHKSLQEYFAAQFIYLDSKEQQKKILEKMYWNPEIEKFLNILDLYYDIDYKTFRNIIIYNLINEYLEYDKNYYVHQYDGVEKKDIIERKEVSFLTSLFLYKDSGIGSGHGMRNENLQPMLQKIQKNHKLDNSAFDGIMHFASQSRELLAAVYSSERLRLFSIFASKKNKLVASQREKSHQILIQIHIEFEKDYEPIIIDDDPNNVLNSRENFVTTNRIFELASVWALKINHTAALKMKEEIALDLEKEIQSDFLLDGI